MTAGECVTCGRRMVPAHRQPGTKYEVMHKAHGKCCACYNTEWARARRAPRETGRTSRCRRCRRVMLHSRRPGSGMLMHIADRLCSGCYQRRYRLRKRKAVVEANRLAAGFDEVVVDRLMCGFQVEANRWEIEAAVLGLLAQGVSWRSVPKRLAVPVSARRVERIVARRRAREQVAA